MTPIRFSWNFSNTRGISSDILGPFTKQSFNDRSPLFLQDPSNTCLSDLVAVLLYALMMVTGYSSVNADGTSLCSYDHGFGIHILNHFCSMLANWKNIHKNSYEMRFVLGKFTQYPCRLLLIPLDDVPIINLIVSNLAQERNRYTLGIQPSKYIVRPTSSCILAKFSNLKDLSIKFKDNMSHPARSVILTKEGILNASLLGVPDEVKLKVLKYLKVSDFLKVSVVSRDLYAMSEDQALWRYFVFRDFMCEDVTDLVNEPGNPLKTPHDTFPEKDLILYCVRLPSHHIEHQHIDNEVPVERSQLLLRLYGDEASVMEPLVRLPSASGTGTDVEDDLKAGPVLFMLPGLEGLASVLQPLARNLKYQTVCLQLGNSYMGQTVQDIAQALLPHIHSRLAPRAPFRLLGYSFGGLVALELALKLEAEGRDGNVYLVDSAPDVLQEALAQSIGRSEDDFLTSVLRSMLKRTGPDEATSASVSKLIEEIVPLNSWDEKIDHFVKTSPVLRKSADYYNALGSSMVARVKAISSYKWNHKNNVKARTILVRPAAVPIEVDEDYGLSKYCEKKVEVHFVTGNHLTILDSEDTATVINRGLTNTEAVNFWHNCTEERLL
ncbi:hypothetical protein Cfor_10100 [Coptotermes formosanus]|uniref:oleoyl-[acyl-carrier-protein] hydrolase n=1 Tax=Coptotermes formosanus TaxID=36987 RepID=A0A6L2Q057_COPFO|nr:hypothetical protein Cfor_10100 [Coptotermes formosanus]